MRLKLRNERGASAVEFALVLPVLALVVFGIIEMSLLLYEVALLTNASREGARAGIVSQNPRVTDTEIKAVVDAYLNDRFPKRWDGTNISFDPEVLPDYATRQNATFGSDLTVTVKYQHSFLLLPDFIINIFKRPFDHQSGIPLEAKTIMKME
jgi:Flp pilus assembly protein TadG